MPPIPVLLACAVFAVIYTSAVVFIAAAIATPDDDEVAEAMDRHRRRTACPDAPKTIKPSPGRPRS